MKRPVERRHSPVWAAAWAAIALCLGLNVAHAASVVQMPFDQLVTDAEVAFEGRVVASESKWNEDRTAILTHVTLEVEDTLKGSLPVRVQLSFLGGTVDGKTMSVSGLRVPRNGEHGIYFVESTTRRLASPILGWNQGQFRVVNDANGQVVLTSDGRPVSGFQATAPSTILRHDEHVPSGLEMAEDVGKAMPLSRFKSHVRDLAARAEERKERKR